MATAAIAKRSRSAYAARLAAKRRRQTISLVVLVAVLTALLAVEIPRVLNRSAESGASTTQKDAVLPATRHDAKPLRGAGAGADPFAVKPLPRGDAGAATAAGPDPFTGPAPAHAASSVASTPVP